MDSKKGSEDLTTKDEDSKTPDEIDPNVDKNSSMENETKITTQFDKTLHEIDSNMDKKIDQEMDRLHMSQNGKCPQSNMYEAGKKERKIVFKNMVYNKRFSKTDQSSSEIRGLCLIKWPSKIIQNLPHIWNKLEPFHQAILSSIDILFLKSVMYIRYTCRSS